MPRTMLTLGARNLGGAILDHFLAQGWNGAAVARSDDTLAAVRERGALAIAADASDPGDLERAMAQTRAEHGSLDLVVNAVSAARPPAQGPFGGGPFLDATMEGARGWMGVGGEQAFAFLSTGARPSLEGGGGTPVKATGGAPRRASRAAACGRPARSRPAR